MDIFGFGIAGRNELPAQSLTIAIVNGTVQADNTLLASIYDIPDIPEVLPNPNALTFTGAVTGTYNGSKPLSVEIPSAVTDDHINELINTALSAIGIAEEGAY